MTLVTLAGCWLLTMIQNGHRKEGVELPVLSETGINAPEKFFFTGGLALAALCFSISAIYLYNFISIRLSSITSPSLSISFTISDDASILAQEPTQSPPQQLQGCWGRCARYLPLMNKINLLIGEASCVFLFLLAVIDLGVYPLLHGILSAIFFICSIAQGAIACSIMAFMRWRLSLLRSKADTISFRVKVPIFSPPPKPHNTHSLKHNTPQRTPHHTTTCHNAQRNARHHATTTTIHFITTHNTPQLTTT